MNVLPNVSTTHDPYVMSCLFFCSFSLFGFKNLSQIYLHRLFAIWMMNGDIKKQVLCLGGIMFCVDLMISTSRTWKRYINWTRWFTLEVWAWDLWTNSGTNSLFAPYKGVQYPWIWSPRAHPYLSTARASCLPWQMGPLDEVSIPIGFDFIHTSRLHTFLMCLYVIRHTCLIY